MYYIQLYILQIVAHVLLSIRQYILLPNKMSVLVCKEVLDNCFCYLIFCQKLVSTVNFKYLIFYWW